MQSNPNLTKIVRLGTQVINPVLQGLNDIAHYAYQCAEKHDVHGRNVQFDVSGSYEPIFYTDLDKSDLSKQLVKKVIINNKLAISCINGRAQITVIDEAKPYANKPLLDLPLPANSSTIATIIDNAIETAKNS